ncbi:MAG: thioesterase family protein [Planctomycetota bacterium]|nr:thioesterase family protein [Planctomycetota bacterium]
MRDQNHPHAPREQNLVSFPAIVTMPVQWGDQDNFGHVNNVIYFRWFESARIKYLDEMGLDHRMQDTTLGPILAAITCSYRKQVTYPDTVRIGAKVTRIGRTSMTMHHAVYSEAHDAMVADGDSTVVVFDYSRQAPCAIPADLRSRIEAIEGKSF